MAGLRPALLLTGNPFHGTHEYGYGHMNILCNCCTCAPQALSRGLRVERNGGVGCAPRALQIPLGCAQAAGGHNRASKACGGQGGPVCPPAYLAAVCRTQAVFLVVRMYLKRDGTSWLHWGGLALTTVVYLFCYGSIAYALGEPARLRGPSTG